jgi:hypothetical protein
MFTEAQRDQVRSRLLELARRQEFVTAAAITGSVAVGASDRWSDIDLVFAVGDIATGLPTWTSVIDSEFDVLHYWDLPAGPSIYRVFLLANGLEVDIGFAPTEEFRPMGPQWRLVCGEAREQPPDPDATRRRDDLIGLGHHLLHARICIERGRPWQAEWLISGLRHHVLALGCVRLGHLEHYGKGTDRLPPALLASLEPTLLRSVTEPELRRALAAAALALLTELDYADPELSATLRPVLTEFAGLDAR